MIDFKVLLGERCLWYCRNSYYYEAFVEEISPSGEFVKVGNRVSDWYPIKNFENTEAKFIEKLSVRKGG